MSEQIIESYNASYSLEYYEIGKVYSFYAKKGISQYKETAVPASVETINQFARSFRDLEDDSFQYSPDGAFGDLIRFYGVVVAKESGDGNGRHDRIIVMIHQPSQDEDVPQYGLKAYVVNYQGIWTDNREILAPKASVEQGSFKYKQDFLYAYDGSAKPEPAGGHGEGGHGPITIKGGGKGEGSHGPITIKGGGNSGGSHGPITIKGGGNSGGSHGPITLKDSDGGQKQSGSKKKKKNEENRKNTKIEEMVDPETGVITEMKKENSDN